MASSLSLNRSIQWAQPFLFYKPLAIGQSAEPALSSANLVEQTIVGPPFRWNWNRAVKSFTCLQQGNPPVFAQDTVVQMSDFGFIEKATAVAPSASVNGAIIPGTTFELQCQNGLSEDNTPGGARPVFISAQVDDNGTANVANITNVDLHGNILTIVSDDTDFSTGNTIYFSGLTNATFLNGNTAIVINSGGSGFTALFNQDIFGLPNYDSASDTGLASTGNITFRLMPVPDQAYTITITYQKKVPLMSSLNNFWTVPDQFSYIYQYGFMSLMLQFSDDPRWTIYNQKFVTHLLAASEGLDATQRNIFLQSWQAITGQDINNRLVQQQGVQARGAS